MKDFKREVLTFTGALLCCFLWGSAFPGIKIGYELWDISGSDTWRIMRFAGVRFFLAGLLVMLFASCARRKLLLPKKKELPKIMLLSAFQTIGQYVFFYLGLAHTGGVNSAVIDSLTTFFAILIAALFMRTEKLTARKMLGCLLGFSGVIIVISPRRDFRSVRSVTVLSHCPHSATAFPQTSSNSIRKSTIPLFSVADSLFSAVQ